MEKVKHVDKQIKNVLYYEIKNVIKHDYFVDICFVCDITLSMDYFVKKIKSIIKYLIDYIGNLTLFKARISFVGFRDRKYVNKEGKAELVLVKDFTSDVSDMEKFIDEIVCDGGDDWCEDVVAGFEAALNLNWKSDILIVCGLLDAPAHGTRYHNSDFSDDYPNDHKDSTLEKIMYHYRKNNIRLYLLKLDSGLDIMIKKMEEYYNSYRHKIETIEIYEKNDTETKKKEIEKKLTKFQKSISSSLSQSLFHGYGRIRRTAIETDKFRLAGIKFLEFEGKIHTGKISGLNYEKHRFDYSFETKVTGTMKCKLDITQVLGIGGFNECHPLIQFDHEGVEKKEKYVAKIPLFKILSAKDFRAELEANSLAIQLAEEFNDYFGEKKITVTPLIVLERIDDPKEDESKCYLVQQYIGKDLLKFNNNYGWVNKTDKSDLAQAFTHFTYEYSRGTVMVVDIQGLQKKSETAGETLVLTDPAVHSSIYRNRFGETNFGKLGMTKFFKTHECNSICEKLKLGNPNEFEESKLSDADKAFLKTDQGKYLYQRIEELGEECLSAIRKFDKTIEPIKVDSDGRTYVSDVILVKKDNNENPGFNTFN